MIAFGPVPSRRLGHSLGINNIPPKICTYSCIYCQLGRTDDMSIKRRKFYKVKDVVDNVNRSILGAKEKGDTIDHLTFVPDGEPTLDINLEREMEALKGTGFRIAVITNASLLWMEEVRDTLNGADWVSVKVDAVTESVWRSINRPHGSLELDNILSGITEFSDTFDGELATETMLIDGVNDAPEELGRIADFLNGIGPAKAYISIPTRPPAENWVKSSPAERINAAYQIFSERALETEHIIGYEGNEFSQTGDVEEDLLAITSVHPMRQDAVQEFLAKAGVGWERVERLMERGLMMEVEYNGHKFYIRNIGN